MCSCEDHRLSPSLKRLIDIQGHFPPKQNKPKQNATKQLPPVTELYEVSENHSDGVSPLGNGRDGEEGLPNSPCPYIIFLQGFLLMFHGVGGGGITKLFPLSLPGLLALEDGGRRCSFLRLVKRLLLSS